MSTTTTTTTTPLNFAPYSDPPPVLPIYRTSINNSLPSSASSSYQAGARVPSLSNPYSSSTSTLHNNNGGVSGMETTIPYDLARLAAAAYLLGPLGAALLLVVELENDYVRYHAWQSALLSGILILFDALTYLIFRSSTFLGLLLCLQFVLLLLLARRAYQDADLLDRYYLPVIGPLAEQWVAEE